MSSPDQPSHHLAHHPVARPTLDPSLDPSLDPTLHLPLDLPRWADGVDALLVAAGDAAARRLPGRGILAQSVTGAIVAANACALAALGLEWDAVLDRTSDDSRWGVVGVDGIPLSGDRHPAMVTLRTGQEVHDVLLGVRRHGEGRGERTAWLAVSTLAVADDRGAPAGAGVVTVLVDATDTPRGRAAADAITALYRVLIEHATDVVLLVDADGRVEWVSPSVTSALQWSPDELVGRRTVELLHPDDVTPARAAIAAALREGRASDALVLRWRTRDGDHRWMNARGRAVLGPDGEVIGGVDALRDVTAEVLERRSADAGREEEYRLLAENASDVVVRLDVAGRLEWISPSVAAVTGFAPEQLVGGALDVLVDPDAADRARLDWSDLLARGEGDGEVRIRTADGTPHWYGFTLRVVHGSDGEPAAVVGSARDIHTEVLAREALAESEQRFRTAMVYAPTGMALVGPDQRLTQVNPALCQILRREEHELLGLPWSELIHPDDLAAAMADVPALLAGRSEHYRRLYRYVRGDGTLVWGDLAVAAHRDAGGEVQQYIVQVADASEAVQARADLAASEQRFRLAWENAAAGMGLMTPDGRFEQANAAMCRLLGRTDEELRGRGWQDLTHPDDLDKGTSAVAEVYAGTTDSFRQLKRYLRPDGAVVWADLTVAAIREEGEVRRLIAQALDVTAEHEATARLDDLTRHDSLTGLLSRAGLEQWLAERLASQRETTGSPAVMAVDLRGFRLVNDSLGHAAGDVLLREVGARLRAAAPPGCAVGRFSGDHFAVVVPGVDDATAIQQLAERIIDAIRAEAVIAGHRVVLGACLGITTSTSTSRPDELVRDAETALAGARATGHNRWRFFDEVMHERAVERLRLQHDLRAAIARREFVVHYQPLVTLHDRAVVGHEALVRWAHPTEGLVAPGRFIPAAEETGLIVEIGAQVAEAVVARLAADPGAGRISLNVSGVELGDPDWSRRLLAAPVAAGADPRRLVVEVTETAVIPVLDDIGDSLHRVRETGIGLHIDDFGTGFSSLSLLRDLPVTGIKLDRSFVDRLGPGGGSDNALASGVAFLAAGLGLETIAEGIETEQQATMLRGQGWREGQGYLFGRPVPWPS